MRAGGSAACGLFLFCCRRLFESLWHVGTTTFSGVTSFVFLVHSLVLPLFRWGTVLPPFSKNLGNLAEVRTWKLFDNLRASFHRKEHVRAERLLRPIFAALAFLRLWFLFLRRGFFELFVFLALAFSFCLGRIKFSFMFGPVFRVRIQEGDLG